jgi:hypothetical protein
MIALGAIADPCNRARPRLFAPTPSNARERAEAGREGGWPLGSETRA